MSDVPRCGHAGPARLQRQGVALERPAVGPARRRRAGRAGEDEAGGVDARRRSGGPAGARKAADAEEERRRRRSASPSGVGDRDGGEPTVVRVQPRQPALQPHLDERVAPRCGRRGRPTSTCRAVAADEHRHPRAGVAEVETACPAELPAPTTTTGSPAALRRLAAPGAVVDAAAEQLVDALELEPPPVHPGRGEHDRRP